MSSVNEVTEDVVLHSTVNRNDVCCRSALRLVDDFLVDRSERRQVQLIWVVERKFAVGRRSLNDLSEEAALHSDQLGEGPCIDTEDSRHSLLFQPLMQRPLGRVVTYDRKDSKSELANPSHTTNFFGSVLGCIEADFSK